MEDVRVNSSMELIENCWDMKGLEKAYRKGYMMGMVGKKIKSCPYRAEIISNAWEAGWQDGKDQFEIKDSVNIITPQIH